MKSIGGFGFSLLAVIAFVACCSYRIIAIPSDEDALKFSISALKSRPELLLAFAIHPEYCSIRWINLLAGWSVSCNGVPLHFYRDLTLCDPGPPRRCGPMPSSYSECVTYEWNVDLKGNPTSPIDSDRQSLSIADKCSPKGTLADDRSRMKELGLAPVAVTLEDYAGSYTGKPRPLNR